MHHRLLLGSTALVSAGVLLSGATPARADIEVVLSGYTEFGALGATDDTLQSDPDRGYTFFMDNEVHIEATGTADSGLKYGSYLAIEAGSGSAPRQQAGGGPGFDSGSSGGNVFVDEVNLFFADGFGRVELGRQDGVEDVMFVGGEDAQAGTGGIDGDTANLATSVNLQNTGDATKASYFTPRIGGREGGGFQLGVSYVPDTNDDGGRDGPGFDDGFKNAVAGGVNWVGAFSGVDLTLSATGIYGDADSSTNDDLKDYAVGGLIGAGGLSFGASFGQSTDFAESTWAQLGLKYKFGNAAASIGYMYDDEDALDDAQNVFVVSGDIGLLPGVVLKGDVSWNTEDPGNDDSAGANQNSTVSGVLSVQMNY